MTTETLDKPETTGTTENAGGTVTINAPQPRRKPITGSNEHHFEIDLRLAALERRLETTVETLNGFSAQVATLSTRLVNLENQLTKGGGGA